MPSFDTSPNDLPAREFAAAVAALPLVSVDWVVTDPAGRLLLGRRINAPARGWWFTPGGAARTRPCAVQWRVLAG